MKDGSIKLGVDLDTDNLKKDLKNIKTDNRKTFEEMAKDTGKSITELKAKAYSLAKEYQKQGMKLPEAYKKAYKEIGVYAEKTTNEVEQHFEKTLTSLNSLAKKSALIFTTGVSGIALASLNVGKNFEAAMDKVSAISGSTESDLGRLSQKALELGANTKFSATESAEALQYMAMAGWKTEDMLDGITGVMNLASASGEDLAMVSDIVTDSLTAFGLQASESGRLADVLAAASSNANTNVAMLGESFKYVAPVAGALGYNIEDTSVALGLMANAGIKASQAGTSLRTFLTNLAAPTANSSKAIKDLSINLEDSQGKMLPLSNVLQQLRSSFTNLTEAQKAQYAEMLAGKEGMSGLLAIVNASESDFNKLTNSINNSAGASERMANKMQDNLQGSLTRLKSTSEAIGISFAQVLMPSVIKIIDKLQSLADVVLNLDDGQKKLLVTVPLVATGLIGIGTVGVKAYNTIKTLHSGFLLLKTSILATSTGALAYNKTQGLLNSTLTLFKSKLGIALTILGTLVVVFKDVDGVGQVLNGTLIVLVASFTAFKIVTTIQKAMKGLTVAMVAQTAVTKGVAIATTLWNVALNANPIVKIITGVVALGTALTLLVKHFTKATDEAEEYNKESQKIIDETKNLNSSLEESASAYEDNTDSIKNSIKANQMLAEEIENLANTENLSKGQKLLLKQKIDELNNSVDGLALSYNEETNQLNMNAQAVEEQLKLQQAQLELNADLEEQGRIREDIAQATELHEQALARLADVTMQLNESENLSYGDRKLLLEQQEELQQATINTQTTIDDLNIKYNELGESIEENASIVEEANEIKSNAEKEYQDALDETGKAMELLSTLTEEEKEKAQKTLEELTKYTTDAFKTINKEATVSIDELISNLNSNIDTVEQWTNDLQILMERGVDEAFIQTLKDAGPEVANTVSAIANASDEKIAELNTVFEKGTNTAIDSMLRQFGLVETINAGSNMIDDLAEGVENNENLNIASENAIKDAKTSVDNQVDKSKFDSAGKDMVTGIAKGVKDNKSVVNNAIKDVARSAVSTFKSELDIHSPSRVFKERSKYINEGISEGIDSNSKLPVNAIKDVADSLTNEFSNNFLNNIKNLPILEYFTQKIPHIQNMIDNVMQSIVPSASSVNNNTTTNNNITNNQGAFNVNISKVETNSNNEIDAFLQQIEFYRKQHEMAIGGV